MFNPLVLYLLFGALFQVANSECIDCAFFPDGYCDKTLSECVYRKGGKLLQVLPKLDVA